MKIVLGMILFVAHLFAVDATIEISKKKDKIYKVMVEDSTTKEIGASLSKKFFKLLLGDLKVSSNFEVIEDHFKKSFDATYITEDVLAKNAELILRYKLEFSDNKALTAKVRLYSVRSNSIMVEKSYNMSNTKMYPFLSHKIISDLNKEMGSGSIDWMNRYVIFSKYTSSGNSSIYLSDYTLTYQKRVVSKGLNLFPKWGDEEQRTIYYTKIQNDTPTLYRYNLYSGKKQLITQSEGMLVCSDVSEDGSKLVLTMSPNGLPDIYVYDLNTKQKQRITKFSGIDVGGQFVEGTSKVVYVSDKLGYPNIYLANTQSGDSQRLVYHGKNNSSCTANGDYIVYSSREFKKDSDGSSIFNLYLISTSSDFIRQLTSYGKNMFPKFAKGSDAVLFIKSYKNQSSLGLIRLNANISFDFPLKVGKIQSIDW